jgi:hypothetical protein
MHTTDIASITISTTPTVAIRAAAPPALTLVSLCKSKAGIIVIKVPPYLPLFLPCTRQTPGERNPRTRFYAMHVARPRQL